MITSMAKVKAFLIYTHYDCKRAVGLMQKLSYNKISGYKNKEESKYRGNKLIMVSQCQQNELTCWWNRAIKPCGHSSWWKGKVSDDALRTFICNLYSNITITWKSEVIYFLLLIAPPLCAVSINSRWMPYVSNVALVNMWTCISTMCWLRLLFRKTQGNRCYYVTLVISVIFCRFKYNENLRINFTVLLGISQTPIRCLQLGQII